MEALGDGYVNVIDPAGPLDIRPVGGRIGAEIRDIDLAGELDDRVVAAIKSALVRHKVVFFREQFRLDGEGLADFAGRLDVPYTHPTVPGTGGASVTELEAAEGYAASGWHTDVTFVASFPRFTLLHGVAMPEAGGDTLWANAATAYDDLPEDLKPLMEKLWTYHDNRFDYAAGGTLRAESKYRQAATSTVFQTEHPAVHVHPDSGARSLLGGSYLKRFAGMDEATSNHLRAILQEHATRPENCVRWRWKADDVAIWDNAATQHRSVPDFGTQRRSLRRATAGAVTPVSVAGRRSRIVNEFRSAPAIARAAE